VYHRPSILSRRESRKRPKPQEVCIRRSSSLFLHLFFDLTKSNPNRVSLVKWRSKQLFVAKKFDHTGSQPIRRRLQTLPPPKKHRHCSLLCITSDDRGCHIAQPIEVVIDITLIITEFISDSVGQYPTNSPYLSTSD
jgi:hypothetical protein